MHFTIEDELAEGDKVASRWTMRVTQPGPFQGHAPTGKQTAVTGMDIFHLKNGMVHEIWVNMDTLGEMKQLGWTLD